MKARVRPLRERDAEEISAAFADIGWDKPASQYRRYSSEQERGEREVLVAFVDDEFAGYVTVMWSPEYPPFRSEGVPEIQDLNVLPKFRRKGVATRLMDEAERMVAKRSSVVGIGVGMTADYGAAQRMYVNRGYVPDGRGLTHNGRRVRHGERVPMDDGLVLNFTKGLKSDSIKSSRKEKTVGEKYVHGYDPRENVRLQDQATTLVELLHSDTIYPAKSEVLEAGCGVGAQTITLARNSPEANITSVDISETSVAEAKRKVEGAGFTNVSFRQGDIFDLPFEAESFDHIFVCFVLEHLARPVEALGALGKLLKVGGTMTVIEGDHGSTFFHPDNEAAHEAIRCQVELQRRAGGNANIGRELFPLMDAAGFDSIHVSPRMVYVDSSRPRLVEGFTKKTFTAMIEGVRDLSVEANLVSEKTFDEGIAALYRTAESDGVFCYTFFKAVGIKPEASPV